MNLVRLTEWETLFGDIQNLLKPVSRVSYLRTGVTSIKLPSWDEPRQVNQVGKTFWRYPKPTRASESGVLFVDWKELHIVILLGLKFVRLTKWEKL